MWASVLCLAVAALSAGWLQGCADSGSGHPNDPEGLVGPFRQKLKDKELWRQQLSNQIDNDTLTECYTRHELSAAENGEHRTYFFRLKNITNAKSMSFQTIENPSVELGDDGVISFSVDVVFFVQGLKFSGIGELIDDTPGKAPADKHNYSGLVVKQAKPGRMVMTWSGTLKENFETKKACTSRMHLLIDAPETKVVFSALKGASGLPNLLVDKNYASQSASESKGTVYAYLYGCKGYRVWIHDESAWCVDWH